MLRKTTPRGAAHREPRGLALGRTSKAMESRRDGRMSLQTSTTKFLHSLRERNASAHTIKAYKQDLAYFSGYVGSRSWREIDHITIRGFLSHLYEKGLSKTSVARSLAAVRSLYRWLAQEGVVEQNPAALVSTPKLP